MNIYDIARQCGVSIATVSRVLNRSRNVSDKTREKVIRAIRESGYTPNAFARGLGLDSMHMVGILCTDIADTFYAKAVSLVESLLRQKGFDALLCCTGNDLENKKKSLDLLLAKRVDAVILIGSAFREDIDNSHIEKAAKRVPVIIINGLVELPNTYCVLCDERAAVRKNVLLLHERGFDDILYVYDTLTYSGCEKIAGYKEGLKEAGLPWREALAVRAEKSVDGAARKIGELAAGGLKFSAAMASEDLLAVGALKAARDMGRNFPVIGFNNSILAQCSFPSLTTVDNMLETMCPTAVRILTDLWAGKSAPQKVVVSPKFVERESFRLCRSKK
jgi:LacI family transcriptional regulator/LacI family asc operon transcriptional repressor